jgi:hypothetical protein
MPGKVDQHEVGALERACGKQNPCREHARMAKTTTRLVASASYPGHNMLLACLTPRYANHPLLRFSAATGWMDENPTILQIVQL